MPNRMDGDRFEKFRTVSPNKDSGMALTILRLVGGLGRVFATSLSIALAGPVCARMVPVTRITNIAILQRIAIVVFVLRCSNREAMSVSKSFARGAVVKSQMGASFEFDENSMGSTCRPLALCHRG